jgi:hypothetical protein
MRDDLLGGRTEFTNEAMPFRLHNSTINSTSFTLLIPTKFSESFPDHTVIKGLQCHASKAVVNIRQLIKVMSSLHRSKAQNSKPRNCLASHWPDRTFLSQAEQQQPSCSQKLWNLRLSAAPGQSLLYKY